MAASTKKTATAARKAETASPKKPLANTATPKSAQATTPAGKPTTKPTTKAASKPKAPRKAPAKKPAKAADAPKTPRRTAKPPAGPKITAVPAAASLPPNPPATPALVESMEPVVSGPVMRKSELIDLVVERSGIKKREAKPVIEAMLSVLGEAVSDGRELNLQPFGKVKVQRAKEMPNARVMVTKIRQAHKQRPDAAE